MYQDMRRIARGAFAQVFTCQAPSFCMDPPELAVKLTDLPSVAGDNSMGQVHSYANLFGTCHTVQHIGCCASSLEHHAVAYAI